MPKLKHILHVVGARPNFMKAEPVMRALSKQELFVQTLVHTGQHYDKNMTEVFFQELELPKPDINLGLGSGSHGSQTAKIMTGLEELFLEDKPDLVLVYGDVNSTLAAALVCSKIHTPLGHVEAGLRSFDRTMPEEINRVLTDQVSDLLFTPSEDANVNLLNEGISKEKIHFVGNVMIDTLVRLLPKAESKLAKISKRLNLNHNLNNPYILLTLHRPSNVDNPQKLNELMTSLQDISDKLPVIFPIHPRTRQRLNGFFDSNNSPNLHLLEPIGYLDFLALQRKASLVITDSGGIQEETTYLKVPCITLRKNTERPVTIEMGMNRLFHDNIGYLEKEVLGILKTSHKKNQKPRFWDGMSGGRIEKIIFNYLETSDH